MSKRFEKIFIIFLTFSFVTQYHFYNIELSTRRVRDINSELTVGEFYTPDELKERGFTLKKITLEGIVDPEAVPKNEEFAIYEIKKGEKLIGWLWKNRFLDEEALKRRYGLFVEAHARMDEILADPPPDLDKNTLIKIDIMRNIVHLWAKLTGNLLGKTPSDVLLDITDKQMKLKGINDFFKGTDDEIKVEFGNSVSLSKTFERVEFVGHQDSEVTYSSVVGFILRAIAEYHNRIHGKKIITYQENRREIYYKRYNYGFTGDQGYKRVEEVTAKITLPDELFSTIKAQLNYLVSWAEANNIRYDQGEYEGTPEAEKRLINKILNELRYRRK